LQHKTQLYPIKKWDGESQVLGWYRLPLDANVKLAVEQHEGIQSVKPTTFMQDFRALPAYEEPQYVRSVQRRVVKDTKLSALDGKWEKQERADKTLRMDSQWK
jgi:hypothetical protein